MYVNDKLVKIECSDCEEEFLVSEYVLKKKTDEQFPGDGCHCPYCGSTNTEAIVWTGNANIDFDELGCLAISHDDPNNEKSLPDLDDLELTVRSHNALTRSNMTTVGSLLERWPNIKMCRGMGYKSFVEIGNKLLEHGLITSFEVPTHEEFVHIQNNEIIATHRRPIEKENALDAPEDTNM